LYEVETQLVVGKNLGYIAEERQQAVTNALGELGRILNGLIGSLQQKQARGLLATGH
jgi:four helix bundle protein